MDGYSLNRPGYTDISMAKEALHLQLTLKWF